MVAAYYNKAYYNKMMTAKRLRIYCTSKGGYRALTAYCTALPRCNIRPTVQQCRHNQTVGAVEQSSSIYRVTPDAYQRRLALQMT